MARRIFPAALSLFLLASACNDAAPLGVGSLEMSWEISPRGCTESGVRMVEAHLMGPEGRIERFECQDRAGALRTLQPGTYEFQLVGIDPAGTPIFESSERTLTIESDRTEDVGTVRLTARPADVHVEWLFSNGRVCGSNDVDQISLAAFDEFDFEVLREFYECNDGVGTLSDLPAGVWTVEVTGYSGSTAKYRGVADLKTSRGADMTTEIVMEPIR